MTLRRRTPGSFGAGLRSTPAPAIPEQAPSVAPAAEALASRAETERTEPHANAAPAPIAAAVSANVVITDDLVERVSRRVLEQLTDRTVRETVATLAERLIREEIERIKASIE